MSLADGASGPPAVVRDGADYFMLAVLCTLATIVAVAVEGFLLTFAWNEFDPIPRLINAAYALLSTAALMYFYYSRHLRSATGTRVRIAAIANLLIVILPPFFFILGLPNG